MGGLVSPASSVFQKHKLLLHYDVAHLLRKGENVLAFTVLYLGGNGQNRTRGCAGLLFELGAELPGGERITISSGKDCRCSGVTEYVPGLPMREPRDLTGSTRVDRSRIEPGWEKPGFQDAGWENAAISPAQFLAGELVDQEIPEGAVSVVWTPACLNREEGFWLFDAGEVLTGFARVRFRAKAGSLLRLRYGELLEGERKTWETRGENRPPAAMRAERSVVNNETETYLDEYVAELHPIC